MMMMMMMMKIYVYLKAAKTSMYVVGSMVSTHNKNQYENLAFYLLYSSEPVIV